MAITVKRFSISNDMKTIDLDVELSPGTTVTSLQLWTENTYKDSSEAIDLTSLLAGTGNTETLVISASDANLSSFSGLYFAQLESSDSLAAIVGTGALTQYYVMQAALISNIDLSCLSCNENMNNALLLDLYITGIQNAMIVGRFQDAISYLKKIRIVEYQSDCDPCNSLSPVVSSAGNIVSVGVIDCQLKTYS